MDENLEDIAPRRISHAPGAISVHGGIPPSERKKELEEKKVLVALSLIDQFKMIEFLKICRKISPGYHLKE